MSGYSEEDDEADRAYWSDPAHGGAGHDHDDDDSAKQVTNSLIQPIVQVPPDEPTWTFRVPLTSS